MPEIGATEPRRESEATRLGSAATINGVVGARLQCPQHLFTAEIAVPDSPVFLQQQCFVRWQDLVLPPSVVAVHPGIPSRQIATSQAATCRSIRLDASAAGRFAQVRASSPAAGA